MQSSSSRKITTIHVESIPCYTAIGIDPEEKKLGQRLLVDVHLDIASFRAVATDNIKDTLSYVDVYKTIQQIGKSTSHSLIEALAEDIAEAFLKHPVVLEASIIVRKPHIPYKDFHGNVSVEVKRTKS